MDLFTQMLDQLSVDEVKCDHLETTTIDHITTCVECGELIEESNLVVDNYCSMSRKITKCRNIYEELPCYISDETKDKTLEIYKYIADQSSKKTLRRVVVVACLHRASIICHEPVTFDDLVKFSGIKASRIIKSINYITSLLPKNSIYDITTYNDVVLVQTILSTIGYESYMPEIKIVVETIGASSNLFNSSHYKSVICGCVYFWVNLCNEPLSMHKFSQKVGISLMTIRKKYLSIKKVLLRLVLKDVFSALLLSCVPIISKKHRKADTIQPMELFDPTTNFTVVDWKHTDTIKVRNLDGLLLPLTEVDDILEWNLLMDKKYYMCDGRQYHVFVKLEDTSKDITFNTTKYSEKNRVDGQAIINGVVRTIGNGKIPI